MTGVSISYLLGLLKIGKRKDIKNIDLIKTKYRYSVKSVE